MLKIVKAGLIISRVNYFCTRMNKRLIILLGTVMGLVLLSLISVQINWIRNAYIVKEQQFDQMVHQALNEIVNVIAREETYGLMMDELNPGLSQSRNRNYQLSASDTLNNLGYEVHFEANTPNASQSDSVIESMQKNTIRDWQQAQKHQMMEQRRQYLNSLITRILSHNPNIEERLSKNELAAISSEVLMDFGIDADFEFAVLKWNNNIAFKSENFNPNEVSSIYRVRLYPDDFSAESNYFDIYFPDKRNFIFRSLAFIGISSGVLTLLIVFTFAFTLYVIFRQKRLSDIKTDFVNNMTHELKTPISTISLASQMLGDNSIPSEAKNLGRISKIIKQESKRLGYQVEKVLQIAAIDKGNLTLNKRNIDIHELIENVTGNFLIQIENSGGLLIPSLHAEKFMVKADPVHLTNVISNLIDNAIKYTPENPEIFIETRNIDDYVQVSVKDNGIGISRNNQKRVFERFYRVPTGNVHNVKGFGLGLNYVKKIIEIHKGSIEVESEPGNGTTFSFRLPLKTQNSYARN